MEEKRLNKWKWAIGIENEPKLKILVEYKTKTRKIEIIGQYKYNMWCDFVENEYPFTSEKDKILEYIRDTLLDLKDAIDNAIDLDAIFDNIKLVEFKED